MCVRACPRNCCNLNSERTTFRSHSGRINRRVFRVSLIFNIASAVASISAARLAEKRPAGAREGTRGQVSQTPCWQRSSFKVHIPSLPWNCKSNAHVFILQRELFKEISPNLTAGILSHCLGSSVAVSASRHVSASAQQDNPGGLRHHAAPPRHLHQKKKEKKPACNSKCRNCPASLFHRRGAN